MRQCQGRIADAGTDFPVFSFVREKRMNLQTVFSTHIWNFPAFLCIVLEAGLALWILQHEKLLKPRKVWISAIFFIGLAFYLRYRFLYIETSDYTDFLAPWVDYFAANGGFRALKNSIGNYNVPYLYFLAAFSYLPIKPLYPIKLLSCLADVFLAWGVLRLCRRGARTPSERTKRALFYAVLLLPTVVLNGSAWGQCDSIYAAFAVWAVALGNEGHPVKSLSLAALSFSFKLQAVFFLPIYLLFLRKKSFKWIHVLAFPATYLLVILPAVLLGRPFLSTLLLYPSQIGSVGSGLNYNSSSIFSLLPNLPASETTSWLGIAAAFFAMLIVLLQGSMVKSRALNNRIISCAAALLTLVIPFFLPHMHDRYFFLADVFTLAAIPDRPALAAPAAALVQFGSLLGYYAYLNQRYLCPMAWGGLAMACAILLMGICYHRFCHSAGA
jgi:Gpi18-like mannosyltransferase